ncbi:DNA-binding domain-containing protein [Reichenbachiella ulvae]|uniref:DUF4469 domain-containing protein n=1 Tax=Reichenbachiella ulvae TaxID=2980104 RepID=A0ABT3CQJ6_9BACT|nr:DNA-binding domain-containing protein [Reichenbachiella ulvae]MCV9385991.1 DUF4469 domain-containing protein [Reichenbachiella ulvae]
MSIQYSLFSNHLTEADDFIGIIQNQESKSLEDLIDEMIGRGSTVTKAEALSVLEEFHGAVERTLEAGYSINTDLFRISPSIQGVFDNQQDSFDRSRHYLRLNVTAGGRINPIAETLKPVKVEGQAPQPNPKTFRDFNSDTINETLSAGGVGELRGSRLKFDASDQQQGVFFIAADGTETRATQYFRNKPSNVILGVPEGLAAGPYRLEVRTIFTNNKSIRKGSLLEELTV